MLSKHIESIEQQMQNTRSDVDKQRLAIPTDFAQLSILIQKMSQLASYIVNFKKIPALNSPDISAAVNRIMLLISEAKICAYIQQAKGALTQHNYVHAQRDFQIAQSMLSRFSNKNSRLQALEAELQELIKSTPEEAANTHLSIDDDEYGEKTDDSIFGPKKKW